MLRTCKPKLIRMERKHNLCEYQREVVDTTRHRTMAKSE